MRSNTYATRYSMRSLFLVVTLAAITLGVGCEGGAALMFLSAACALLGLIIANFPMWRDWIMVCGLIALSLITTVADVLFALMVSTRDAVLMIGVGIALALPLIVRERRPSQTWSLGVFFVWMFLLTLIEWDDRKPFQRVFARIRPGMTIDQVTSELRREFPGASPRFSCSVNCWFLRLGDEGSPFNAEIITIQTHEGRVLSADYARD